MFAVHFSSRAKREFDRLRNDKLDNILKILTIDPLPAKHCDIKKLRGLKNTFRIRIGKIRIVYTVFWEDKVILISRISHREHVYD
ncbi:MAG: type II toxin-antitoxin system RelE/ParE family toxin [Nanoarchaeota archaeon]|nr:type II toxin-antitoxin system RelE/ParE family toxin [Nanoarchaeota archaeon]MBU1135815.1 type II toxin-antitoxin system RelE/ParE family toxin [Nanoarchaeota archaeon]